MKHDQYYRESWLVLLQFCMIRAFSTYFANFLKQWNILHGSWRGAYFRNRNCAKSSWCPWEVILCQKSKDWVYAEKLHQFPRGRVVDNFFFFFGYIGWCNNKVNNFFGHEAMIEVSPARNCTVVPLLYKANIVFISSVIDNCSLKWSFKLR